MVVVVVVVVVVVMGMVMGMVVGMAVTVAVAVAVTVAVTVAVAVAVTVAVAVALAVAVAVAVAVGVGARVLVGFEPLGGGVVVVAPGGLNGGSACRTTDPNGRSVFRGAGIAVGPKDSVGGGPPNLADVATRESYRLRVHRLKDGMKLN